MTRGRDRDMRQDREQSNILFIMTDQHRFDYVGCSGSDFLHTPHLDGLAARGIRFTHCCTNAAICAPARIGLATGLQPVRVGALDNQNYLPYRVPTYYQRLRDYGYRVGCVGKLHLAGKPSPDSRHGRFGDRPCVYGWGFTHPEECEGKMNAGLSPTPWGPYTHFLQERGLLQRFNEDYRARARRGWIVGASHDSVLPADAVEDAYIGQRAVDWIERVPDEFPWHLFVSFVGPHDPFDPPTLYADRYRNAVMPPAVRDTLNGKPAWVRSRLVAADPEEVAVTRRQYCAAITLIDEQIGLILAALERRGMLENTYIIFTSDHGEMLGDHGLYTKQVAYEPSLRIPLIAAGPGIAAGRVSDALIELIDLNPTIGDLVGMPAQDDIDAQSFAAVLRGERATHRSDVVSALRNHRCIRTERYKLIQNFNEGPELYDLEEDPQELRNLASAFPDMVRDLASKLEQRFLEGTWLR